MALLLTSAQVSRSLWFTLGFIEMGLINEASAELDSSATIQIA